MEDLQPLIRDLGRIEYGANRRAVAALVSIGGRAVPPLCLALEGGDPLVRTWAAEALGKIGDPRAVSPLCRALRDEDRDVRRWTAIALVAIGKPAVPSLGRVLGDRHDEIRERAALVLGEIRDPSAAGALCERLRDREPVVRRRAAEALGKIAEPGSVVPLCRALEDEDWGVRRRAAHALGRIAEQAPIRELRAGLPSLYRYSSAWSFESPGSKAVYRTAAQRIDEATSWVRDFPLPAQPPPPSPAGLPAPAISPPPDGRNLPLPMVAGQSVEPPNSITITSRITSRTAEPERPASSPLAGGLQRLTEALLSLSSMPFS